MLKVRSFRIKRRKKKDYVNPKSTENLYASHKRSSKERNAKRKKMCSLKYCSQPIFGYGLIVCQYFLTVGFVV